jgi:hypothetical protein
MKRESTMKTACFVRNSKKVRPKHQDSRKGGKSYEGTGLFSVGQLSPELAGAMARGMSLYSVEVDLYSTR